MEDERLIELVRENRALYDISHVKYMDPKYKTNLWNKIGAQLKFDGEACKARWNNIRDNYRKSLKKTHTKSGQKRTNVKLYKYHEQLFFLNKYLTEGKRKESVDQQEEYLQVQEVEEEEVNQTQNFAPIFTTHLPDVFAPTSHVASTPTPSHVTTPSPNYEITLSPSHVPTPSPNYEITPSPSHVPTPSANYELTPSPSHASTPLTSYVSIPSSSHTSTPSPSKKKKGAKFFRKKTAAASLMEYVLQKKQASAEVTQHPVDAFLNCIAPTLKGLNQYYLHLAKSEIFATVQKYEMKMMQQLAEQNVKADSDIHGASDQ